MKKCIRGLLLFLAAGYVAGTYAYDFQVDGIYYTIVGETVEVDDDGSRIAYSGEVVIPPSVTYNGEIYPVTSIGEDAFYGCTGLTSIVIPESVTSIDYGAFWGCTGLTSITIPESVTSIGGTVFWDCTGLTEVIWNARVCNIEEVGFSHPFYACDNIKQFTFGDNVELIPAGLCLGLTGLTSIEIPESVKEIEPSAFYGCTGLTTITIPELVTSIGDYAFSGCTGLTEVIWNARLCSNDGRLSSFSNCTNITTFVFGDEVSQVPDELCYGLSGLTSVTIGESVTSIGAEAFSSCTGLTTVTIPNSVTSIGAEAFSSCTGLTSVTIGNSVTSIDDRAFYGCTGVTTVTIPESVVSISNYAFMDCTGLTSVQWNARSCSNSGETSPFSNCTNITAFVFGDEVSQVPDYLCYGLSGLTSVTIPESVTQVGDMAFIYCTSLASVEWNVRQCDDYTVSPFWECTALDRFVFGEMVEYIPAQLCNGLTNLSAVTIPESVTSIGGYAFVNCSGLTSITIPESVTVIGDAVFSGCSGVTTITIPSGVTHIGDYAFWGMRLESVMSQATTPPEIWSNTFDDYGMTLYVPAGSKVKYQTAKYWRNFTDIQETGVTQYRVDVSSSDDSMGSVMGSGEYAEGSEVTLAAIPADGYRFVRWSDGNTENPRRVTVTGDMSFVAEFEKIYSIYSLSVVSNDEKMGRVTGGGEYKEGEVVTITAIPADGYRFVRWNDGNTENPRRVTVTGDMTFVAEFELDGSAVESPGNDAMRVYVVGRTLHVENNTDTYRVYTASGQLVYMGDDTTVSLADAGVYIVRTGERSQKVIVK